VFLAKYFPQTDGKMALRFWTWIGGTDNEDVRAMTVDSLGRVYIVGSTNSADFPLSGYTVQRDAGGALDAFISVIDPSFSGQDSLVVSSFYGGAGDDVATAVAVDSNFNILVTGYTKSENLLGADSGVLTTLRGGVDAFLIRINPLNTSALEYATYYGAQGTDVATGLAVDASGIAWISGYTGSNEFPTTVDALSTGWYSFFDGFLLAIDTRIRRLDGLVYASYFGGNSGDYPTTMRIDSGTLWVAGYTFSTDLPVTANAVQRQLTGDADMFVMAFALRGSTAQSVTYATYLGGNDSDVPYGLTVLAGGRVALAGYTVSPNFPLAGGPVQSTSRGGSVDGVVSVINTATANGLEYSSYLGGALEDVAFSVAVDSSNAVYACGSSISLDFPYTDNPPARSVPGLTVGWIARVTR
jgi:hypothetical protein